MTTPLHELPWPQAQNEEVLEKTPRYADPLPDNGAVQSQEPVNTYAPNGPHDEIEVHPKRAGYSGFSSRVWWVAGMFAFVVLLAFAWKSGLFSTPHTTASTTLMSQVQPNPVATSLANVDQQSNAVPVGSSFSSGVQRRRLASPGPQGQNQQSGGTDYQPGQAGDAFGGSMRLSTTTVSRPIQIEDPNSYLPQQGQIAPTPVPQSLVSVPPSVVTQAQEAARASLVVTDTTASAQNGGQNSGTSQGSTTASQVFNGDSVASDAPAQRTGARFSLWAGDIIPAMLDSGIVSEIPGPVVAHIERNVYDSRTGHHLLIPGGSRVVGSYGSSGGVVQGQTRMAVEWKLLIFPDGYQQDLSGLQAADLSGNVGLPASVNNHEGKIFKTTAILGGLAALSQLAQGSQGSVIGSYSQPSVLNTIASSQAQQMANTATNIVQQQSQMAPTLTVAKGTSFTIVLDRTLVLPAYDPGAQ
jgi:type IV secretory pathway VirB10-like protein